MGSWKRSLWNSKQRRRRTRKLQAVRQCANCGKRNTSGNPHGWVEYGHHWYCPKCVIQFVDGAYIKPDGKIIPPKERWY